MKKQCFITKTNERTGRVSKLWGIYETKKEAKKVAKEMREEEKECRARFPEWFEGKVAEDTYKYEVHELEKDHELYERLEKESQKRLGMIRSHALRLFPHAYYIKTAIRTIAERRKEKEGGQQTNVNE